MARTVKEWIAKNDDARIPDGVKRRIVNRQEGCCALSGKPFGPDNKPEFDHKVALWLGGEHRESNLHAISSEEHKAKTKAEATVRAKVNSQFDKHIGIKSPSSKLARKDKQPKTLSKQLPARKRPLYAPAEQVRP